MKKIKIDSQKKKDLILFFLWFRENGERYVYLSIEDMIEKYLSEGR